MIGDRYFIRPGTDGTWTIADVFTNRPIGLPVERAEGLPQDQAAIMALYLNDLDRERRHESTSAYDGKGRRTATNIASDDEAC